MNKWNNIMKEWHEAGYGWKIWYDSAIKDEKASLYSHSIAGPDSPYTVEDERRWENEEEREKLRMSAIGIIEKKKKINLVNLVIIKEEL